MDFTIESLPHARIVRVIASRIDAAATVWFKDRMREITVRGRPNPSGRVVLDLALVDFVDSSGLGAIVATWKGMPAGQVLELAALNPNVERVFQLTRMDRKFAIHPDVQSAVQTHAD
ncbi:STAS domain-containing protein [Pseudooceanicola aestuarii]|uniref:STAS domain-containing protein n=1 Tax=Pseudooceanicola aestuarii TaxID=2697319 RepID=UPI0013D6A155|nr:STAS domain-containing protein [Pseudooceanicola aestuarii]